MASLLQIIRDMEYNLDDFQPTDTEEHNMEGTVTYNGQEYRVSCSNHLKIPEEVQIAEMIKKEIDEKAAAIDDYVKIYMTFNTDDVNDCENSIINDHLDYMTADEVKQTNKIFLNDILQKYTKHTPAYIKGRKDLLHIFSDAKKYLGKSKTYHETISISKEESDLINHLLSDGEAEDRLEEDDVISHTVRFSNGFEADIKCCGSQYEENSDNAAWTEAVLFDRNSSEISCSDVSDEYVGDWVLEDNANGNIYLITVKVDEKKEKIL